MNNSDLSLLLLAGFGLIVSPILIVALLILLKKVDDSTKVYRKSA